MTTPKSYANEQDKNFFSLEGVDYAQEMSAKPSSIELADMASGLMKGVAGWLLIALGVAGVLTGLSGSVQQAGTADILVPILLTVFALLLILLGVFVNPRFRRRLDRRYGPSRFGRVKTVEHRTRSAAEECQESCVVCGSLSAEGLIRRYREEYVVVGMPFRTVSEEHNFYCPDCALIELSHSTDSTAETGTTDRMITETE